MNSSRNAVRVATKLRPDVRLVDIGMPDIDGLTLAPQLRSHPDTRHTVLIGLSGYGQAPDRSAAHSAGFDVYLVKPVDVATLADVLTNTAPATSSDQSAS